jgi:hypothetical protein
MLDRITPAGRSSNTNRLALRHRLARFMRKGKSVAGVERRAGATEGASMYDRMGTYDQRSAFERTAERFLGYLRSRTADHWLMFAAGVVLGLMVG